jgi:hypothetical protein
MAKLNFSEGSKVDIAALKKAVSALESPKAETRKRHNGTTAYGGKMIQENNQSAFGEFAEAFDDHFRDIFAKKDVAAEPKKHKPERERQPMQVETRARLTGERVREIVSGQVEELADFVESLLLDQRELMERQHTVQLELLSKIVTRVGQIQGASHAESSGLASLIRETINAAVLDAATALRIEIDVLQRTVEHTYKLQAAPLAWIVGEMFNLKARLTESRIRQSPGRRRRKVSMRTRA